MKRLGTMFTYGMKFWRTKARKKSMPNYLTTTEKALQLCAQFLHEEKIPPLFLATGKTAVCQQQFADIQSLSSACARMKKETVCVMKSDF